MKNFHTLSYTIKHTIFILKKVQNVQAEEIISSPFVATLFAYMHVFLLQVLFIFIFEVYEKEFEGKFVILIVPYNKLISPFAHYKWLYLCSLSYVSPSHAGTQLWTQMGSPMSVYLSVLCVSYGDIYSSVS